LTTSDISKHLTPPERLFAIVLAAGGSSRFGSTKQLAKLGGEPLVARAVRLATEVFGERCVLVLGKDWRDVAAVCKPLRGFLVVNTEFDSGMASSIAAGTGAVAESASGILLLLADQPLVDAAHLRLLVARWMQNPQCIVASEYAGIEGPPVLFPADYFDDLMALQGDHGARTILRKPSSRVLGIRCENAGFDIDSPADLESLSR